MADNETGGSAASTFNSGLIVAVVFLPDYSLILAAMEITLHKLCTAMIFFISMLLFLSHVMQMQSKYKKNKKKNIPPSKKRKRKQTFSRALEHIPRSHFLSNLVYDMHSTF